MNLPQGWVNPILNPPGSFQKDIEAKWLLPSRKGLCKTRLDFQRLLLGSGQIRFTPIQVTKEGVIWDGHHAVRAAAEKELKVEVIIINQSVRPCGLLILDLPVG